MGKNRVFTEDHIKWLQDNLKNEIKYNKETGEFWWLKSGRGKNVYHPAGSLRKDGYRKISLNKTEYKAYRLAWFYVYGIFPKGVIDHINHNKDDNSIKNLRDVSLTENQRNRIKTIASSSNRLGVTWYKPTKKWAAAIWIPKHIHLGYFINKEDAIKARIAAEEKYGFM